MGSIGKCEDKELDRELLPFIRIFKDGTILRPTEAPRVPPSPSDPVTGGASKDITISEDPLIRARLHLPKLDPNHPEERFPVLVYTHGGGFCFESAFSLTEHQLQTSLVSEARILAVSVEYRLAPVHPVTTTYDDCWQALQWVAAHATPSGAIPEEPWLAKHGNFSCGGLFVGGDSAGSNIAHHLLMRAGREPLNGGMKISAAFLTHPYFWGSEPIGKEPVTGREVLPPHAVWMFLCPGVEDGVDNPMLNVVCEKAPSLAGLGCERLLIGVAEDDLLLDRGIQYYNAVKESGWKGEAELVVVPGEDHAFHIIQYQKESAAVMIKRMATFLTGRNKRRPVDDSLVISSPPV